MPTFGTYKNINVFASEQFKESVSETVNNTNLYLTYAQIGAWETESAPPNVSICSCETRDHWRSMLAGKIVTGNDIEHAIKRYNWTANTSYVSYDDTNTELFDENVQFYVITSDYNVYKCLSNANNSISTVEPSSTNPATVTQTADGFIWKYMYTLNSEEKFRFINDEWIPVKTLPGDDGSVQWDVQENANDGAIYDIRIENAGNYTTNNITITIDGDGTGANAYCDVNTISNTISTITIDNYGTGYSNATATITGGGGTGGGSLRPIITPEGGHGFDPLYELGGSNLFINMRVRGTEDGNFPVVNEIRQISLIKDPFIKSSNVGLTNTTFKQTTTISLTGVSSSYDQDEYVYQGPSLDEASFYGRVVEYDAGNTQVKLNRTEGVLSSDTLIGANTGVTGFVTSSSNPEAEPFTGKMLYLENIENIQRDENQTENFQIIMKF